MAGNSNSGRPALTDEEKDLIFRKLEPYLKSGLSLNKACLNAQIPKSTVYEQIKKDTIFADKIETAKQFFSIAVSNVVTENLRKILQTQETIKGDINKRLPKDDLEFIKWLALNSKNTKEEFGSRADVYVFDPQAEIQKINDAIDEVAEDDDYDDSTTEE